MDDDIPDHVILIGWVVAIIYSLRKRLVFVDLYAPLDLQPPGNRNGAVD